MKKLSVENVLEGMILAREVCGTSGNILLIKGTQLNPALGRRLKNWGIPFVYIEGEEESMTQESAPSISPEDLKKHLMAKFSDVINNPLMKQIFAAVFQFRLQKNG